MKESLNNPRRHSTDNEIKDKKRNRPKEKQQFTEYNIENLRLSKTKHPCFLQPNWCHLRWSRRKGRSCFKQGIHDNFASKAQIQRKEVGIVVRQLEYIHL